MQLASVFVLLLGLFCSFGTSEEMRRLEIDILQSIAYSSYTSQQVFWLLNWKENDQTIRKINRQPGFTFKAQHNQFSKLSFQEIQQMFLTLRVSQAPDLLVQSTKNQRNSLNFAPTQMIYNNLHPPRQQDLIDIDWRAKGMVSSVKSQGVCGACWAFSATSQIQSKLLMNHNLNVSLSQQQLIDCSQRYGNIGCVGGMMDNAFRYIISNGITLAQFYPYKSAKQTCKYRNTMKSFRISKSKILFSDCPGLKKELIRQPVTVVISADLSFIFYGEGILNTCGEEINHAIQLVGYYKDSRKSYYIGKNSWGVAWGQQGFIKIDANAKQGNLCSVCAYPQFIE